MNSLGFNKKESDTRVVVAMSGGVDSSVVAALLKEQGYEVIGVTLQLYDHGEAIAKKGACCAGQDIYDAKRIAEKLNFPHYVLDYESRFKESVINDFADSYLKGETPIPCIRCNQTVKFNDLFRVAKDLDADCLATGHYIRRTIDPKSNKPQLSRAPDMTKDQSYFLFATTAEQLEYLRFPLGNWDKETTREHAKRLKLITADKPDSQDICFVPQGDYKKVVSKIRPEAQKKGNIVHLDGRIVGKHDGIIGYTIGQRKGLGIGGGVSENNAPLYVIEIDANKNEVKVGPKEDLARDVIFIKDCNWIKEIGDSEDVLVKYRSIMKPVSARIKKESSQRAIIYLNKPEYGISAGQAAVCYNDNIVLGGGWISSAHNSNRADKTKKRTAV